jgi:hypothetical protein
MATNINGVTMPTPSATVNENAGDSFTMGGVISTVGGGAWAESGDMYFEWDQGTGTWVTIGSTGYLQTADTNPILLLQTAVEQQVTIDSDVDGPADAYQIRVKLIEDDLTTHYSGEQTVNVAVALANYKQKIIITSIFT